MAVYTKLSEEELKYFFSKYNLGKLLNYKEIKEGIENTNYFIKTEKGKFILTLYEKRVEEKDLPFFISLMKNLFDKKFPSPQPIININGSNYKTKDGTCIRDYIHIKDICRAIDKSINYLFQNKSNNTILNIGNGKGLSNKEIIFQLQKVMKKKILFEYTKRRKGDSAFLVCNISKVKSNLNWRPLYSDIKNIIKDDVYWNTFLAKKRIFRKLDDK